MPGYTGILSPRTYLSSSLHLQLADSLFKPTFANFLPAAKRHGHAELFRSCCCCCAWHDVWLKTGNFCFFVHGSFIICLFRLPWQTWSIFALISIHFYQPRIGRSSGSVGQQKKERDLWILVNWSFIIGLDLNFFCKA